MVFEEIYAPAAPPLEVVGVRITVVAAGADVAFTRCRGSTTTRTSATTPARQRANAIHSRRLRGMAAQCRTPRRPLSISPRGRGSASCVAADPELQQHRAPRSEGDAAHGLRGERAVVGVAEQEPVRGRRP